MQYVTFSYVCGMKYILILSLGLMACTKQEKKYNWTCGVYDSVYSNVPALNSPYKRTGTFNPTNASQSVIDNIKIPGVDTVINNADTLKVLIFKYDDCHKL